MLLKRAFGISVLTCVLVGLYSLSRANYLLFHSLVETFSVVVACGVFMVAWNSRRFHENGFFLCLGVASLFVASVDLLHTLAYKGMGVFPAAGPNLPTQLWITSRYLEASSFLAAHLFLRRQARPSFLFGSYLAATVLLLAAVFGGFFPDCFREGAGLTPFKVGSEYLICLLLAASLALLHRRRHAFSPGLLRLFSAAVVAFVLAELSFTLYTDVFGFANMAGHLFKIAGFYLIYRGVIETGLTRPYDLLFRDLKQSEEALRQRTRELEDTNLEFEMANEELAASNDQLEVSIHELEAANADLEAFNYSVSHDLRGPLTVISGQTQIILHLYDGKVDDEVREFLETIHSQTLRMNELITTLLDFARLNKVALQREEVDLAAVARPIALSLQQGDPGREAVFDIREGSRIEADPKLMEVLLENLLGNAWKYTGREEVARIEVGALDGECGPVCFVRDNGAGFDLDRAGDLFAPFKRLHDSEAFEGSGIGLATVKRIVDRHGGRVWAQSAPGEGATFFFTFSGSRPRGAAPGQGEPDRCAATASAGSGHPASPAPPS